MTPAPYPLRLLLVDANADDAEQIADSLRDVGYAPDCVRVQTPQALTRRLRTRRDWDLLVCDAAPPKLELPTAWIGNPIPTRIEPPSSATTCRRST